MCRNTSSYCRCRDIYNCYQLQPAQTPPHIYLELSIPCHVLSGRMVADVERCAQPDHVHFHAKILTHPVSLWGGKFRMLVCVHDDKMFCGEEFKRIYKIWLMGDLEFRIRVSQTKSCQIPSYGTFRTRLLCLRSTDEWKHFLSYSHANKTFLIPMILLKASNTISIKQSKK